jgi:hypothetical protein
LTDLVDLLECRWCVAGRWCLFRPRFVKRRDALWWQGQQPARECPACVNVLQLRLVPVDVLHEQIG